MPSFKNCVHIMIGRYSYHCWHVYAFSIYSPLLKMQIDDFFRLIVLPLFCDICVTFCCKASLFTLYLVLSTLSNGSGSTAPHYLRVCHFVYFLFTNRTSLHTWALKSGERDLANDGAESSIYCLVCRLAYSLGCVEKKYVCDRRKCSRREQALRQGGRRR
jgi:hypothetical protein